MQPYTQHQELFRIARKDRVTDFPLFRQLDLLADGKLTKEEAQQFHAELEKLGHLQTAAAVARFIIR